MFVENLKHVSRTSSRHTGPSTLFRYFYKAGFDQVGAETMYGPEDVTLAALRGASKAYGKKGYGAHLALQWCSTPLDDIHHAYRYFLSLACCYLHGVNEINTEEGLWRMENKYAREDRFGKACEIHREWHLKFQRFVQTHSRRGQILVPTGIIQGQHCGWTCFERGKLWGQNDPSMRFGAPEESFDLLKLFYPRSDIDKVYRHNCGIKPQGWYSGSPYGPVDILPIEAPQKVLNSYKSLSFLGWNTFKESHFKKLLKYVDQGGSLLMAKPHISKNIKRFEPSITPDSPALREMLGDDIKSKERVHRQLGKGQIIFYGQDCYPSQKDIKKSYTADLKRLTEHAISKEYNRGWIKGGKDVDFTVYANEQFRVAYLLNIAWWQPDSLAKAELLLGNKKYPINVPFGAIRSIAIKDNYAIMPANDDVDVISIRANINGMNFQVQADGASDFSLYCSCEKMKVKIFSNNNEIQATQPQSGVWNFKANPGVISIRIISQ